MIQAYELEILTKENCTKLEKFINETFEIDMKSVDLIPIEKRQKANDESIKSLFLHIGK